MIDVKLVTDSTLTPEAQSVLCSILRTNIGGSMPTCSGAFACPVVAVNSISGYAPSVSICALIVSLLLRILKVSIAPILAKVVSVLQRVQAFAFSNQFGVSISVLFNSCADTVTISLVVGAISLAHLFGVSVSILSHSFLNAITVLLVVTLVILALAVNVGLCPRFSGSTSALLALARQVVFIAMKEFSGCGECLAAARTSLCVATHSTSPYASLTMKVLTGDGECRFSGCSSLASSYKYTTIVRSSQTNG